MTHGQDPADGQKLRGWKEIARHLRADERTVRRWEERGLPVRRVPGEGRSSVFADTAELDRWLSQGGAREPEPEPPAPGLAAAEPTRPPAASRRRPFTASMAVVVVVALVGAAAAVFGLVGPRGAGPRRTAPATASQAANLAPNLAPKLADEARLQNARATPEGFRRAIDLAQAALARDPASAEAYAELAFAWIRLPEVDATVDRQAAYERAQKAAQRALDIDPRSWRAHSTMGFIEYGYHWNFVAGIRHFREVIRINPSRGPGHNQLGIALLDMGDTQDALVELELSSRLEASNPIYRAYYAQAQYVAGDRRRAVATWRQILSDNPNLVAVRELIQDDALARGDWPAAAEQGAEIARLRHDPADTRMYRSGAFAAASRDREALFKFMLRHAQDELAAGRTDQFELARIYGLFGRTDAALDALHKALDARDPYAISLRIDPLLASVRADPRFEQLATAYGITPAVLRDAP